jgi:hypothetical protein
LNGADERSGRVSLLDCKKIEQEGEVRKKKENFRRTSWRGREKSKLRGQAGCEEAPADTPDPVPSAPLIIQM